MSCRTARTRRTTEMSLLDFPRWKIASIWGVLAIGIMLSIPSLLPRDIAHRMPAWVQRNHVNLGLDLAGGSHLLLEAQTGDVARQRVEMMEDNVRRAMRTASPRIDIGDVSTSNGQLSFVVRDPARAAEAANIARDQARPSAFGGSRALDVKVDGATIVMRPTQAGLEAAISSAMDSARDVIDRRINALGTLEPTIVRQGANRILVQVPGLQDPEQLKQLIGRTARLEFKLVDLSATPEQIQAGRAPIGSQILPMADGGRIAVQRRAMITGDQIADARQAFDPQDGRPTVSITFDSVGARRFAR